MPLSFGFSPWFLILCLLAAGALAYWSYSRTRPKVSPTRRGVLIALRFAALFIVISLLFEPIWRQIKEEVQLPVLALAIDNSQSLGLQTESENSTYDLGESTRDLIQSLPLEHLAGEVKAFAFDQDTQSLSSSTLTDSLRFEGSRTDISQALIQIRDELESENLGAVLLVSDGQYNSGRNPIHVAERYPVPIFTVAVGDTLEQRDIQVRRITTNSVAYVDEELPVQIGIRSEDYGGEQVIVSLLEAGNPLSSETVILPEGTGEIAVDMSFVPETEGLHQLTATVTQLSGEVTYRNNVESFTVRVLNNKRRLLIVAAAPDPDLATIRQLISQDGDTEVTSFVQKDRSSFYEGAFPASLDDFDIVVLVGFPGSNANPESLRQIVSTVEDGTPLLFLLTRQTDLRLVRQYLSDILPAFPQRNRSSFAEASFVLTTRGSQHPILEMSDSQDPIQNLPPLIYNQSRWTVRPDARVLATIDVRGVQLDDPLLVVGQQQNLRTAALLGTGIWRWKNLPDDQSAIQSFWPTLFANIVQWLSTPDDNRQVKVEPVQSFFSGQETIQFSAQVYDESLNPVEDASVTLNVRAPDNSIYPYTLESVGSGRYLMDIGTLPEGTYSYDAEAQRNSVVFGADEGSFAVGALTIEFKETRADAALLRQIAQRSGGSFMTVADVVDLPEVLANADQFQPIMYEESDEAELWHLSLFLAIVVTLLTLEWFLRKRSGMV